MPSRSLSIEDRKLDAGVKIVASSSRIYSDIDLAFKKKKNGDIFKKTDANAVKQAVKNLILTNHYEKPFVPFFGGSVRDMLFELGDQFLDFEVEQRIKLAIENFEPRVEINEIKVIGGSDNNSVSIHISFFIVNQANPEVIQLDIERIR